MNRREFIKNMAITAGSLTPFFRVGAGLGFATHTAFASAPSFGDYKALVIIQLDGGNDAMNMFIPLESSAYNSYETIRGSLALSSSNLFNDSNYPTTNANTYFSVAGGASNPYYATVAANPAENEPSSDIEAVYRKGSYHTASNGLGINGVMPEMADLYQKGKLSIISNVGTLVRPTTKAQIEDGTAQLPVFLFAHNHQQRAIQTAQADVLGQTGWAGRVADAWSPLNTPVGLGISYGGVNRMLIGENTSPLAMGTGTPTSYNMGNSEGERFEEVLVRFADNTTNSNFFESHYGNINKTASQLSTLLTTAWSSAPDFSTFSAKNSYGQALFTVPDNSTLGFNTHDTLRESIFNQLEAAAKMIKLGQSHLSYNRQIFYVQLGGFDSHSGQIEDHTVNLRSVSLALSDFYKALEEMGLDDKVLALSTSDFGRTLQSNGDGTDHGWGGHSFMLCGDSSFNGGQTFGTIMTDLSLTGANTHTNKARMIPTTSIEQMLAPALKWFGVDNALMATVLPNLSNFETSSGNMESAFLQGVFI